jgi:hypothetical protein
LGGTIQQLTLPQPAIAGRGQMEAAVSKIETESTGH